MASLCKNTLSGIHFVCQMMILRVPSGDVLPVPSPITYLSFTLCCHSFRRGVLTCCPPLRALNEHCIANTKFTFSDSCTLQRSPLLNSHSYIAFFQTAASLLPVRLLQMTCATALARGFFLTTLGAVLGNPSFPHMVRLLLLLKGILQQPVHCGAVRNICLIIKIYGLNISQP